MKTGELIALIMSLLIWLGTLALSGRKWDRAVYRLIPFIVATGMPITPAILQGWGKDSLFAAIAIFNALTGLMVFVIWVERRKGK